MTNALTQYKKEIAKNLRCCGSTKARLMERFEHSLSPFLEECPTPDRDALYTAFGPPESMAGLLMSEITSDEVASYRRQLCFKHISAGILAALFFAFTFYVYFEKQKPIEVKDQIIVEAYWTGPDDTGVSPSHIEP